jgi:hypothetical protein
MTILHPSGYYNNNKNSSLSPMATKPTTFQNNNKEQQQQQYQIQIVSRVSQQQQLQMINHQQQQHNHILPTYVPGPAIVNNNATMALQQQPQQQDNVDKDGNVDDVVDCNNNNDEAISVDASSLPSNGSIRPDPNYNPARDPMNPINQNKPFVPPLEITIKTVRGRRRKYMRSAEQEQRGIEEQQQDQDPSSSLCRSPLPTASTPLQQQSEWLQSNSGGQQQQQRPQYHHQSPTLCRSPLPPTLMIPVMNVGPSYTPTTPTTSCGGGNPMMIAAVQPTHSFTEVSKSNTTATTVRGSIITQLSLEEYQLNLHPSIYYDQEEPSTTDLVNSDKFRNDNTATTEINNNINEDIVLVQQQQNNNQRKGMVRRELTRRVFQFKKKKTNNDMMIGKNNNSTDHNAISGDDIDRVFGVIDTNTVVDSTEAEAAAVTGAAEDNDSKNNTPTKNAILGTKKKNKSPYSIFSTINITGMMAKQGQENNNDNDNDNESSIVV